MKKIIIVGLVLSLSLASGLAFAQQATAPAAPAPAAAAPAPAAPQAAAPAKQTAPASVTIARMEIAGSVENRQPVGVATSFPASQEKVYCYLELKDVAQDQTITYAWTFGQDTDKVTQQIRKSARWRTWGNKSIAGRTGDWKVDVLDEAGNVLQSATFKVE